MFLRATNTRGEESDIRLLGISLGSLPARNEVIDGVGTAKWVLWVAIGVVKYLPNEQEDQSKYQSSVEVADIEGGT